MKPLRVKLLSRRATIPTRSNDKSAGWDIASSEDIIIRTGERRTIHTGLAIDIKDGHFGDLTGRSGINSKSDLFVKRGIIDEDYQGEVKVVMYNASQPTDVIHHINDDGSYAYPLYDAKGYIVGYHDEPNCYLIKKGDRIAQLIETPYAVSDEIQAETFESFEQHSVRGDGGFGSSGLN